MRLAILLLIPFLFLACERRKPVGSSDSGFIATPNPNWSSSPSFWIWGRWTELGPKEIEELKQLGVPRLYPQVGEIDHESDGDANRPRSTRDTFSSITKIPTIRIKQGAENLGDPSVLEAIGTIANFHLSKAELGDPATPSRHLQIDYDCPASLLPKYAEMLRSVRQDLELTELSITALASWIDAPGFDALAGAVDELVPMFYDLEADQPKSVMAGQPLPMVDEDTLRWIRKWQACPVPWRAGLPNFQRLTQFSADGELIGHHRSWSLEDC